MGSPPSGTSTMTLTSWGGFLPRGTASIRMRPTPGADRRPARLCRGALPVIQADLGIAERSAEYVGGLAERRPADPLGGLLDALAAHPLVEGAGALVVGQRPDNESLDV